MAQPNLTLSGPTPPERLGRYLLGRELGRGFSSVVFEATDPLRGRQVALKVLTFLQNLSPARRQELTERFEREARAISTLSHPSIVAIYEIGHADDGREFIAMEYLEGETLRARLERAGPLPAAEALPLLTQIADALQYAHGRGIIHRDVKPDNVFVCPDGTAKLMDFGVAHVFADDGLTQTGTVVGSPAYMSPEQINGRWLDGRSDVFSLGVTLAEALTGRKPFEAPNIPAVMNQILHRPAQLAGITARPLRRLLERALAKNLPARLPSAGAFAAELRRLTPQAAGFGASPGETVVMALPAAASPRPVRRAPWTMLLPITAALTVAALAVLPFVLHRRASQAQDMVMTPRTAHHAPAGRTYRVSTEWQRARPTPRVATVAPIILAPPPLREGEARVVEQAPAPPASADILRLLRQGDPVPLTAPAREKPSAAPPRVARASSAPAPSRRRWTSPPVRVAAAPAMSNAPFITPPAVRLGDSRQERPATAAPTEPSAPPPTPSTSVSDAPPVNYPYGTGPAPEVNRRRFRGADVGTEGRRFRGADAEFPDSPPRLVHRTDPAIPGEDRGDGGSVRLRVFINEDGDVDDAVVSRSSGSEALDEAAIAAVLHWEYEPAFQGGRAVPATVQERVSFDR